MRHMTVLQVRAIFFAYADHCIATGERPAGDPIELTWHWHYERERKLAAIKRPYRPRGLSRAA
ncbi:MAG TPA: hypothetical protein VGG57_04040 [Stellaceae bacterium]